MPGRMQDSVRFRRDPLTPTDWYWSSYICGNGPCDHMPIIDFRDPEDCHIDKRSQNTRLWVITMND